MISNVSNQAKRGEIIWHVEARATELIWGLSHLVDYAVLPCGNQGPHPLERFCLFEELN